MADELAPLEPLAPLRIARPDPVTIVEQPPVRRGRRALLLVILLVVVGGLALAWRSGVQGVRALERAWTETLARVDAREKAFESARDAADADRWVRAYPTLGRTVAEEADAVAAARRRVSGRFLIDPELRRLQREMVETLRLLERELRTVAAGFLSRKNPRQRLSDELRASQGEVDRLLDRARGAYRIDEGAAIVATAPKVVLPPVTTVPPRPVVPELRGLQVMTAGSTGITRIDLGTGAATTQPVPELPVIVEQIVDRRGYTAVLGGGIAVLVPDSGGARFVTQANRLMPGADPRTIWLEATDGSMNALTDPFGQTSNVTVRAEGYVLAELGDGRLLVDREGELTVIDFEGDLVGVVAAPRRGTYPQFLSAVGNTVIWGSCPEDGSPCALQAGESGRRPTRFAERPVSGPAMLSTRGHLLAMAGFDGLGIIPLDGAASAEFAGSYGTSGVLTIEWVLDDEWVILAEGITVTAVRFGPDGPQLHSGFLPGPRPSVVALDRY
jgi:hypothetical protein